MPFVLVIDDDLFFSVRIETTLKKLGYEVAVVGTGEKALEVAAQHPLSLVIINFVSRKYAAAEVIHTFKNQPASVPVLCFMPHVRMHELRPSAKEAGADLVVANSALTLRLPQLAAKLAPLDGTQGSVSEAAPFAEEEAD